MAACPIWKYRVVFGVHENIHAVLDDPPDNVCPVRRGEDNDEPAADDDDTGQLHASEHDTILSNIIA